MCISPRTQGFLDGCMSGDADITFFKWSFSKSLITIEHPILEISLVARHPLLGPRVTLPQKSASVIHVSWLLFIFGTLFLIPFAPRLLSVFSSFVCLDYHLSLRPIRPDAIISFYSAHARIHIAFSIVFIYRLFYTLFFKTFYHCYYTILFFYILLSYCILIFLFCLLYLIYCMFFFILLRVLYLDFGHKNFVLKININQINEMYVFNDISVLSMAL